LIAFDLDSTFEAESCEKEEAAVLRRDDTLAAAAVVVVVDFPAVLDGPDDDACCWSCWLADNDDDFFPLSLDIAALSLHGSVPSIVSSATFVVVFFSDSALLEDETRG